MLSEKAILGMMAASPEKRYKSFLNMAADTQQVWMLESEEGSAIMEADGYLHLPVWPAKKFAELFREENEEAVCMDVHDFLDQCRSLGEAYRFMVFPTNAETWIVTAQELCEDLQAFLEEVE